MLICHRRLMKPPWILLFLACCTEIWVSCLSITGNPCTNNTDCATHDKHAECKEVDPRITKICDCEDRYLVRKDTGLCAAPPGEACDSDAECLTGRTSTSCTDNECTCKYPAISNTSCLVPVGKACNANECVGNAVCNTICECKNTDERCRGQMNDPCKTTEECLTDSGFLCKEEKCTCKNALIYDQKVDKCRATVGGQCQSSQDCLNSLSCVDGKTCECERGMAFLDGSCQTQCTASDQCQSGLYCENSQCRSICLECFRWGQCDRDTARNDRCDCTEGYVGHRCLNVNLNRSMYLTLLRVEGESVSNSTAQFGIRRALLWSDYKGHLDGTAPNTYISDWKIDIASNVKDLLLPRVTIAFIVRRRNKHPMPEGRYKFWNGADVSIHLNRLSLNELSAALNSVVIEVIPNKVKYGDRDKVCLIQTNYSASHLSGSSNVQMRFQLTAFFTSRLRNMIKMHRFNKPHTSPNISQLEPSNYHVEVTNVSQADRHQWLHATWYVWRGFNESYSCMHSAGFGRLSSSVFGLLDNVNKPTLQCTEKCFEMTFTNASFDVFFKDTHNSIRDAVVNVIEEMGTNTADFPYINPMGAGFSITVIDLKTEGRNVNVTAQVTSYDNEIDAHDVVSLLSKHLPLLSSRIGHPVSGVFVYPDDEHSRNHPEVNENNGRTTTKGPSAIDRSTTVKPTSNPTANPTSNPTAKPTSKSAAPPATITSSTSKQHPASLPTETPPNTLGSTGTPPNTLGSTRSTAASSITERSSNQKSTGQSPLTAKEVPKTSGSTTPKSSQSTQSSSSSSALSSGSVQPVTEGLPSSSDQDGVSQQPKSINSTGSTSTSKTSGEPPCEKCLVYVDLYRSDTDNEEAFRTETGRALRELYLNATVDSQMEPDNLELKVEGCQGGTLSACKLLFSVVQDGESINGTAVAAVFSRFSATELEEAIGLPVSGPVTAIVQEGNTKETSAKEGGGASTLPVAQNQENTGTRDLSSGATSSGNGTSSEETSQSEVEGVAQTPDSTAAVVVVVVLLVIGLTFCAVVVYLKVFKKQPTWIEMRFKKAMAKRGWHTNLPPKPDQDGKSASGDKKTTLTSEERRALKRKKSGHKSAKEKNEAEKRARKKAADNESFVKDYVETADSDLTTNKESKQTLSEKDKDEQESPVWDSQLGLHGLAQKGIESKYGKDFTINRYNEKSRDKHKTRKRRQKSSLSSGVTKRSLPGHSSLFKPESAISFSSKQSDDLISSPNSKARTRRRQKILTASSTS